MSHIYDSKKRNTVPEKAVSGTGPSLEALRSGTAAPSREQMGRRVDLPDAMREKMEASFGADLSAVRLYESRTVADAGAEAVTQGSSIAFAPGMLDFTSYGGQALLGHELSHVVSQSRGEVTGSGFLSDQALEARADREGAMAAAGQQIALPTASMSPVSAGAAAGPMQAKKQGPGEKEHDVSMPSASADTIRADLEQKSGVSLDDVNVHYNSPKPAEIGAYAYAKGTDVFMGPGQEKYLSHELTHVVQQKQGLVHPTGSVGGMPVNTSESLEGAADRMQVTSAPAVAAPASAGVVQGVFQDRSGKRLSPKEVDELVALMSNSLQGHRMRLQGHVDTALAAREGKGEELLPTSDTGIANSRKLISQYSNQEKTLKARLRAKMNDKDNVYNVEDTLSSEIPNAFHATGTTLDTEMPIAFRTDMVATGMPELSGIANATEADLPAQDTTAGYDRTASAFHLTDTAYEGVSDIRDFDPSKDKADYLTMQRMGNSTTLIGQNGFMDSSASALKKQKKAFTDATEVARKGAVNLRKSKDDVTFGQMFNLFSTLNKTVRKGDKSGGLLRGNMANAGNIQGVGTAKLPETMYKTFSTIANSINQIKRVQDRDLQKSQAIQLASFAYQMTLGQHVFSDGNGRSCRLLSDTILQTFGLPPHLPSEEEKDISYSMGSDVDFDRGANVFKNAVSEADLARRQSLNLPSREEDRAAAQQPAAPRQGFFKRIGSFFKNLFGRRRENAS